MLPGVKMRVRLDDRLGVAAVTYVLFGVKLGPALALFAVLVFAIWIGGDGCAGTSSSRLSCFALIKALPPAHPWLTLGREPSAFSVSTP